MRNKVLLSARALALVSELRQRIVDPKLCHRHRRRRVDFSRQCRLTFPRLMLLLLQKSLKSLQARLHEFFWQLTDRADTSVTAGALTHARAKLAASAFVELNEQVLLPLVYGEEHPAVLQRWHGHRLLGVDSSVVRLPNSEAVVRRYGRMPLRPGQPPGGFAQGRLAVVYDLLNEVALQAALESWKKGELAMAREQLRWMKKGDVVVCDRGYASYRWMVGVQQGGADFVIRCSRGSFPAVQELFARNQAGVSLRAWVPASKKARAQCDRTALPAGLAIRFVTVRLATGELEVLATSLLDAWAYPTEEFGGLYWRRWGQETYFRRLKGRLDLEHCSGLTVDAVQQDFAAMVLLSNIESVVIGPASAGLTSPSASSPLPAQINRAVSLHALKTRLIDLLASNLPPEQVLAELTQWFNRNPVAFRKRTVARQTYSPARSYHFQRYVKKIVF
jgi:Transposase DDE domain